MTMTVTRVTRRTWRPTFDVVTESGPVQVTFTDGGHASVMTTGHVNDNLPLITWRNRELLTHIHLYASTGWGMAENSHPYVSYRDGRSDASPTAVAHAVAVSRAAVAAVLAEFPEALVEAERDHLTELEDRQTTFVEHMATELRGHRAELRKTRIALARLGK